MGSRFKILFITILIMIISLLVLTAAMASAFIARVTQGGVSEAEIARMIYNLVIAITSLSIIFSIILMFLFFQIYQRRFPIQKVDEKVVYALLIIILYHILLIAQSLLGITLLNYEKIKELVHEAIQSGVAPNMEAIYPTWARIIGYVLNIIYGIGLILLGLSFKAFSETFIDYKDLDTPSILTLLGGIFIMIPFISIIGSILLIIAYYMFGSRLQKEIQIESEEG